MPLSSCPECYMPMKVTNYEDVLIDVCPSCRGVWLDRGELQKIIAIVREEESGAIDEGFAIKSPKKKERREESFEYEERREKNYDKDYDKKKYKEKKKKKKGWGFFDALEDIIDFD